MKKSKTLWCYLDGKKHCDAVQWASAGEAPERDTKKPFFIQQIENLADLEDKLRSLRFMADSLLKGVTEKNNVQTEYFARQLSLLAHELTEFELVYEVRRGIYSEENEEQDA